MPHVGRNLCNNYKLSFTYTFKLKLYKIRNTKKILQFFLCKNIKQRNVAWTLFRILIFFGHILTKLNLITESFVIFFYLWTHYTFPKKSLYSALITLYNKLHILYDIHSPSSPANNFLLLYTYFSQQRPINYRNIISKKTADNPTLKLLWSYWF